MSSVHVARQGFITKSALPSVTRTRGSTQVADKNTVLLLNGNGTNGAQNNTFLDSSTNNFTITRNGNATQGSFSPFSPPNGQWSNYFDGTGDSLSVSSTVDLTADFTIECWANANNITQDRAIFGFSPTSKNVQLLRLNADSASNTIMAYADAYIFGSTNNNAISGIGSNEWFHLAMTRQGSVCRLFVNGVLKETNSSFTATISINRIGAGYGGDSNYWRGYISNARIVNGTAVYTSAFTPPTTSLTAITNTVLLTCQSNIFKDNSSNNFAITRNGDTLAQPFSPFAPTAAYSTSVNGGSMYFDGTGDYLTVATNAAFTYGVSDFTMECWVYLTTTGAIQYIIDQRNSGTANAVIPAIYVSASNVLTYFVSNAAQITGTTALAAGVWYHVAVSRSTLSTKMFLNGVQEGSTYTDANSYVASSVVIGSAADTAGNYLVGYVSNVRLVNGTGVYTTAFTPPTAPLTAITNTSLLLSGTNAGIFDNAAKNDLETVDSAQVSTSVKKYGTGSMYFDGTVDSLNILATPQFNFLSENFTIEFWVNPTSWYGSVIAKDNCFIIYRNNSTSTTKMGVRFNNDAGSDFFSTDDVPVGSWSHWALVRNGNVFTWYLNGVSSGSSTQSITLTSNTNPVTVGKSTTFNIFLNGYIDDLRITKGVARYTANFTPPTTELVIFADVPNNVTNSTYGVYQLA